MTIKVVKDGKNVHNGLTYGSNPVLRIDPFLVMDLERYLRRNLCRYTQSEDCLNYPTFVRDYDLINRVLCPFGFELVYYRPHDCAGPLGPLPIVRPIKPFGKGVNNVRG